MGLGLGLIVLFELQHIKKGTNLGSYHDSDAISAICNEIARFNPCNNLKSQNGISIKKDADGVRISGYIDGSDSMLDRYPLIYPIKMSAVYKVECPALLTLDSMPSEEEVALVKPNKTVISFYLNHDDLYSNGTGILKNEGQTIEISAEEGVRLIIREAEQLRKMPQPSYSARYISNH